MPIGVRDGGSSGCAMGPAAPSLGGVTALLLIALFFVARRLRRSAR